MNVRIGFLAFLGIIALTGHAAGQVCNSLFAALVAEESGVQCDQALVSAHTTSTCPANTTPNRCAQNRYFYPPDPLPAAGEAYQAKWLPRCKDGTDTCRPRKQVRCIDGTRPLAYIDKAIDIAGNDALSNVWVFYLSGVGGGCHGVDCWDRYKASSGLPFQNSLSTYHASYQIDPNLQTKDSIGGRGMFKPDGPFEATRYNLFAHFNRIELERCSEGAGNAIETITLPAPNSQTTGVYHHGTRIWSSLFAFLDTAAGRDLGGGGNNYTNGPDLPPLSDATHVLLVGQSEGGMWMTYNADRLAQFLTAISPTVEVKMVIDGRFDPMLENEARYNGQSFSGSIFASTHGNTNPAVDKLPPDNADLTDDDYSDNNFVGGGFRTFLDAVGTTLDQSCIDAHIADPEYCYDYQHVLLNHVKIPFFISMDQLDEAYTGKPAGFGDFDTYKWTDPDFSLRVMDQTFDYLNLYHLDSEMAPGGSDPTAGAVNWSRGVFSPHIGGADSHVGVMDNANFSTEMTRCSGSSVVQTTTVNRANALYHWFINDTEFLAAAGYIDVSGANWVNTKDACSATYP